MKINNTHTASRFKKINPFSFNKTLETNIHYELKIRNCEENTIYLAVNFCPLLANRSSNVYNLAIRPLSLLLPNEENAYEQMY